MPAECTQPRAAEVAEKLDRLRTELDRSELDAILLTGQRDVAWITGGLEDPVLRGEDPGLVWALVDAERALLITQNVEAPRIRAEEPLDELRFEVVEFPWYQGGHEDVVRQLCDPAKLGSDHPGLGEDVSGLLVRVRMTLTAGEIARLRAFGADCCDALEGAVRSVVAGTGEHELAAEIVRRLELKSVFPSVLLVGADDRRRDFRHPTVATAPIQRDVLAVIVAVRGGQNLAASRTVSIGDPDPALEERHRVACEVEAQMINASRVGATYTDVFEVGAAAYERLGYPDQWRHHYQGGPMTYAPRDFQAMPRDSSNPFTDVRVEAGQAFAWNPTVQGAKSEDTFLVTAETPESVSNSSEWPSLPFEVDGVTIQRPDILRVGG